MDAMKVSDMRRCKWLVLLMAMAVLCTACRSQVEPVSLGIPTQGYYGDNYVAQCVWDLAVYEGKLYAGSGDFDKNAGPVPLLCYDPETAVWQEPVFLPDEQIGRFVTVDGKLTAPGFDPDDSPQEGTYYQLEGDTWITKAGLPDGLHNFDLVEYDGKLFAGIGAISGESPIAVSTDGAHFDRVPLLKDGVPVDTTGGDCVRVHHFFELDGQLYAQFWYEDTHSGELALVFEMYVYREGAFHFHSDLNGQISNGDRCRTLPTILAKGTLGDRVYLTTGRLYVTEDMVSFSIVSLPGYARTYDIVAYGDRLYLATATPAKEGCQVTVYSLATDGDALREEVTFAAPLHPTALAIDEGHFYVAVGDWRGDGHPENGTVMQIER